MRRSRVRVSEAAFSFLRGFLVPEVIFLIEFAFHHQRKKPKENPLDSSGVSRLRIIAADPISSPHQCLRRRRPIAAPRPRASSVAVPGSGTSVPNPTVSNGGLASTWPKFADRLL